jgi:hypothetical protein
MFLTPLDETLKRMGSEILFLEQVVAKQKSELEAANASLDTARMELEKLRMLNEFLKSKVEIVNDANGYEPIGAGSADKAGGAETESLSGQRRGLDDWSGPHSNGGAAQSIQGNGHNRATGQRDTSS